MDPMEKICRATVFGLALLITFGSRRKKDRNVDYEPDQTLGEVVEYLIENPGKIFLLKDRTACMVYYPPHESVLVIDGDFDGNPTWCNFMLAHRLHEMGLMD